jgi:hypothetical protein
MWGAAVSLVVVRGYGQHWDWFTWCLLGILSISAIHHIVAHRRKKAEISQSEQKTNKSA